MKSFLLITSCLLILFAMPVCHAITPVTNSMIQESQEYGTKFSGTAFSEFIRPWTVYEEKAAKLDYRSNHAFIYTPFSLAASDARIRKLSGKPITIDNGKQVIEQYHGYLTFCVTLYTAGPAFTQPIKATLSNGGNAIAPVTLPKPEADKTAWYPESPQYISTLYLYFPMELIDQNIPSILSITTEGKHSYKFYFDLPAVK